MTAVALDHIAPYSVHDLLVMPDDGQRYEVQDGSLMMSPAPSPRHQWAARRLTDVLEAAQPEGVYVHQDVLVRLRDDGTGYVPDVLVGTVKPWLHPGPLEAEQALGVVEIVSPSNRKQDRVMKPHAYAEAGIPCFWRIEIDPFPGQLEGEALPVIFVHRLVGDRYELITRVSAGRDAEVRLPYPVTFDPAILVSPR